MCLNKCSSQKCLGYLKTENIAKNLPTPNRFCSSKYLKGKKRRKKEREEQREKKREGERGKAGRKEGRNREGKKLRAPLKSYLGL